MTRPDQPGAGFRECPASAPASTLWSLALCVLFLWLAACGRPVARLSVPVHDGPVLLITIEGLRADVLERFGGLNRLTPNLNRLSATADWTGRGVAPSSWVVPSMGSLFTGLRPWQHGAVHPTQAELDRSLVTLAEALEAQGYRGDAYRDSNRLGGQFGFSQGFAQSRGFGRGARASRRLEGLAGGKELVWVHLKAPALPYVRHDFLLGRLPKRAPVPPERVRMRDLAPYVETDQPMPPELAREVRSAYLLNAAWADFQLGRLLRALQRSGQRDQTLIAVVSIYGQDLGEHGGVADGGGLGRHLIEAPWILDLPEGFDRQPTVESGGRAASRRLWGTLVDAVGGEVPPGVAPSLFRPGREGILSELYLADGANELSWVAGDLQLRWTQRLRPPRGESFRSPETRSARETQGAGASLSLQPPEDLLVTQGPPAETRLLRWVGSETVERVNDPALERRMTESLLAAWGEFVAAERPLFQGSERAR